ncbi:dinitrogenase iron-molybdenum cofactor biosynthesis protein [Desulfofundulus thermobenzoicus]|uniref:Dinitrogenase iron-molybdenum cofactor biosynthesis protein n=2 Tax=Desulfofundulus thermobenzoicus TaxID=29376 RepID=A0A6N7IWD4_9FIRM|nr:dinitrogenase iron-molybdenum cofactor biosynthesis protein [Desulfofundulus thermobenzoicus]
MKVAISAQKDHMDAPVEPRFGRCPYFILTDTDGDNWEALPNTGNQSSGGAGVQTAQLLVNRGVQAVLVGQIGPNAMEVLLRAGIQVYGGVSGTVRESLNACRQGRLPLLSRANSPKHAATGRGRGGR